MSYTDDQKQLDALYENLHHTQTPAPKRSRFSALPYHRRRAANTQRTHRNYAPLSPQSKPRDEKLITIRLPFSKRAPKDFISYHSHTLLIIGMSLVSLLLVYGSAKLIMSMRTNTNEVVTNTRTIAPEAVYTPRDLPDGYSVGSASETLENGAVFFTIYDNKGSTIFVTQQARPQNFDEQQLAKASKFETPSGTGYVLEEENRTTGYLFTDKSWVLLNSTDGVTADQMREVIQTLKY